MFDPTSRTPSRTGATLGHAVVGSAQPSFGGSIGAAFTTADYGSRVAAKNAGKSARKKDEIVDLGFPREWITFSDPEDPEHEIRADATWLLSRWTCIFGSGCKGVVKGRPDDGCCSHGAFFSDKKDEKRVRAFAREMTAEDWQLRKQGKAGKDVVELDDAHGEQRNRTRVYDGACIFLNRPDHPAGAGCSLHGFALRTGRHPLETKPDVCWQLPMWRDFEDRTTVDEREIRTTILSEYDRRQWGPGGEDLNWYCTSAPAAHVGSEPVYRSNAPELVALIGQKAYDELARLLDIRESGGRPAPHPAGLAHPD